ncbi:MAG: ABC transporter permease [Anaerolineales bacterium]|jgi:ABC-2 type transport system permease protein
MRLSKAWIVASKDFKTYTKRKSILYSIFYFELVVSIGIPFLVRFITGRPNGLANLPNLINAFSFLYVIGAALLPVGIASYSLIGEKVQKSLEPLLATPTTDEEILAGKSIAAFLPAIGTNIIGALIFMVLVNLFTHNTLNYQYFPNWEIAIILFLLAPLACLLSVGYNILVSSRMNDVRTAQQLGTLILLPFGVVYLLTEIKVLQLTTDKMLIIAAILFVIDGIVFYLVKATFQRDEILTKWK